MQPAWRLDHREVNRIARERWGLRWPVVLMRRRYLGVQRWAGHSVRNVRDTRTGRCSGWEHTIRFPGNVNPHFALACIAHELEHGAQNEALGAWIFDFLYDQDQAGFEKLATDAENRWPELLPAVKGAA